MDYIYNQIKNVFKAYNLDYTFDASNQNYQFSLDVFIEGFYPSMAMYIYVNESELLFTMVTEKVKISEAVYTFINTWNFESLMFKVYIDDNHYLVIESYHGFVGKDHFQSLLTDILDVSSKEVLYFKDINHYFTIDTQEETTL